MGISRLAARPLSISPRACFDAHVFLGSLERLFKKSNYTTVIAVGCPKENYLWISICARLANNKDDDKHMYAA